MNAKERKKHLEAAQTYRAGGEIDTTYFFTFCKEAGIEINAETRKVIANRPTIGHSPDTMRQAPLPSKAWEAIVALHFFLKETPDSDLFLAPAPVLSTDDTLPFAPGPYHVSKDLMHVFGADGFLVATPGQEPHISEKWHNRTIDGKGYRHWATNGAGVDYIDRPQEQIDATTHLMAASYEMYVFGQKLLEMVDRMTDEGKLKVAKKSESDKTISAFRDALKKARPANG